MREATGRWPRAEDLRRHLQDLRTDTYEGRGPREERIEVFRRAVELADPVVRRALEDANAEFLDGTGTVQHRPVEVTAGGDAEGRWELSWPEQRGAENIREAGGVAPVQVLAWFAAGFTHPHLRGSRAGDWPFQVLDERDAERLEPVVRAIVEVELHQRVFEGTWGILPGFARRGGDAPDQG